MSNKFTMSAILSSLEEINFIQRDLVDRYIYLVIRIRFYFLKEKRRKKHQSKIENVILIIPPHTLTTTCSKTRYSTNECSTGGGDAR